MAKRVGIVAVAQTGFSPMRSDLRTEELAYQAVKKVMDETGLKWAEDGTGIDCSVAISDDFWEARTISEVPLGDILGAQGRDTLKVAQDGSLGVLYSAATIMGGHDDVILLLGVCKESQILDRNVLTCNGFDPIFQRGLGIDHLAAAGLQANRYMHKYGITREQCAKVVVKNRANAKNNPFACAPADLTVEQVMKSRVLATPLTELDIYPVADGAIAMILATEEKAKKLTNKPVWIKGFSSCRDAHNLGDRELADCDALVKAAAGAYKMAGIGNPRKDIDVVELSEHYSYQELMWSEGLGLCDRGQGGKLLESGQTALSGKQPVNPSGGIISGVPALIGGLYTVAEGYYQLRDEAGKRQVKKARTALAHGTVGACGQMHCVIILGN